MDALLKDKFMPLHAWWWNESSAPLLEGDVDAKGDKYDEYRICVDARSKVWLELAPDSSLNEAIDDFNHNMASSVYDKAGLPGFCINWEDLQDLNPYPRWYHLTDKEIRYDGQMEMHRPAKTDYPSILPEFGTF